VLPTNWLSYQPQIETFLAAQTAADPAHDLEHVRRVVRNAVQLAALEHADLAVVLPAAWLHDCVSVRKDSPQRAQASRLAAAAARTLLLEIGYPADSIPAIEHAISAHSFSAQIAPATAEARVVQDADRLDSLGAVGLARCLMLSGAHNRALYHPKEPFPLDRTPDDLSYTVDHFYTKLLGLVDTMQTDAGRAEAQRRTRFLHTFLEQLGREITQR
jgi:uncharacterized protein